MLSMRGIDIGLGRKRLLGSRLRAVMSVVSAFRFGWLVCLANLVGLGTVW